MKKLLAMLLALAMVFALAACGGSTPAADTQAEAPAEESAAEAEAPAAEAPAEEPAEAPAEEPAAAIDPLTISFNATYRENEANGLLLQQFGQYVSDLSDGAITVNFMWGGTVYNDMTQFTALRDGAIDMISIQTTASADYVPYMSFAHYGVGDGATALQLWNEVMFENEETSALITAEAEANNIKYLNAMDMGSDVIVSNFEWSTLQELIDGCVVMGAGDYAQFEAMGITCTFVIPPETYDALQRGICDSSTLSLAGVYSMSWDEVANNVVMDGLRGTGGCLTVNLDWWNSLTDAQREVIQEAADMVAEYSIQMNDEAEAQQIAEIEERSNTTVKYLSEEDASTYYGYIFDTNAVTCLNRVAGDAEKTAGMNTILQYVADYYGVDWSAD